VLLNAAFAAVLMAIVAGAFLCSGLAVTRAVIHHGAQQALIAGYDRARSAAMQTLASAAQQGVPLQAIPAIAPMAAQCVDTEESCAYRAAETIVFTGYAADPEDSCSTQNSCLRSEQENPYVDEGRISARISVIVTGSGGEQLAAQSSVLVLRTLRTPPYVVVSGARDIRLDAAGEPLQTGDDGGMRASFDPCASPLPGTTGDTAIHVVYRRTSDGHCTSGEAWHDTSVSPGSPARWTY
jgi:hypothetical protein